MNALAGEAMGPPQATDRRRRLLGRLQRRAVGSGTVGVVIIVFVAFGALLAPLISPYDPNRIDLAVRLSPPGHWQYPLGTDQVGRDMLSRLIWGARSSLVVVVGSLGAAAVIGLVIGAVAGYLQGPIEGMLLRLVDIFFGFPPVLLAILVAVCLGPSLGTMIVAMLTVYVPPMVRVAYQSVVAVRSQAFVEAARVSGANSWQMVVDQILPNALTPVVAYATSLAGQAVVFGAGLSFVGLGVQPPDADWGRMINDGRAVLLAAPWVATLSGLAIFLTAVGFNMLGDAVHDRLDPRAIV
jgi:ABC-type dipeptide/oligopeptide/nickel transport system permease subunit